jgi:hypothetical protein
MADVTWHSLGIDQGFLATMGDVNFHGSFDAAHRFIIYLHLFYFKNLYYKFIFIFIFNTYSVGDFGGV